MNRLDVGLVYTRYPPAIGGAETQLHLLAAALARRHRVRVVAPIADQSSPDPHRIGVFAPALGRRVQDGVDVLGLDPSLAERLLGLPSLVYYLPRLRRWFYGPLLRAGIAAYRVAFSGRLARRLGAVSAVYSVALNHLGWAAFDAARLHRCPFVLKPLAHPGQYGDDEPNLELARRADAVIALVEPERDFYVSRGVQADRVHVIGVAPILTAAAGHDSRLSRTGPIVAFVGRQTAYKGVEELASAVRAVRCSRPDVSLVLAGPRDPRLSPIEGPGIVDLGPVDDATKTALLAAATVLCLPSRHEILPAVVLEAWALGKPVIVGDIPYLRFLVHDGRDGWVSSSSPRDLAAAIERVLADPDRARAMGERGRERVAKEYELGSIVAKTEQLLLDLVARGPRGQSKR